MKKSFLKWLVILALCPTAEGAFAADQTGAYEIAVRKMSPLERQTARSNSIFGMKLCEMVQATNSFQNLSALAASFKRDTAIQTNGAVLFALVDGIRSRSGATFVDSGTIEVPSRVRSGKMQKPAAGTVIRQDVFLKGGRAAWFLEQILNFELPEMTEQTSDEELEDVVVEAYYQVKEALLPLGAPRTITGLSLAEKRELAESADSNPVIFYKLSKDSDASIRTAVAANKNAPGHVLFRLTRDKDESVKKRAHENLKNARLSSE